MNYHVDFCVCDKVFMRVAFHFGMIENMTSDIIERFSKKFRNSGEDEHVLEQIEDLVCIKRVQDDHTRVRSIKRITVM
jgi:hypothetical protein